jgi:hypothetical protein
MFAIASSRIRALSNTHKSIQICSKTKLTIFFHHLSHLGNEFRLLHFYVVVEYFFNPKGLGQARHQDLKVV